MNLKRRLLRKEVKYLATLLKGWILVYQFTMNINPVLIMQKFDEDSKKCN